MSTQPQDAASFAGLQEGALALADISGYSKFVAQTEVDHSWSILHEVLDTVVRSVHGRMDVSQVEGDAILFISGLTTPEVIDALEGTFVAFHRRLRDMQAVTTCPCDACANIGILKLLVTDAVLDRLPDETRKRFIRHSEEFDLGTISGGYQEIAYQWDKAQATERKRVQPEEAQINSEVVVGAPRESVYRRMLEPRVMERYLFADDEPQDADVAATLRQMMQAMVTAGEGAIKEVFAS
jgi:hypothetical protein